MLLKKWWWLGIRNQFVWPECQEAWVVFAASSFCLTLYAASSGLARGCDGRVEALFAGIRKSSTPCTSVGGVWVCRGHPRCLLEKDYDRWRRCCSHFGSDWVSSACYLDWGLSSWPLDHDHLDSIKTQRGGPQCHQVESSDFVTLAAVQIATIILESMVESENSLKWRCY